MFIAARVTRKSAPLTRAALRAAEAKALYAGAVVIQNEVKKELRGGYRSTLGHHGDFVTGNSLNHVAISEVLYRAGRASIRIGTDLLYNLFWEIGHHNIFTRHFERDEKWAPAFRRSVPAAQRAYARVMKALAFGLRSGGAA